MDNNRTLSIVIPAYNEETRIGATLEEFGKFFEEKKRKKELKDFEILVVLNACKDNTLEIVKKYKKKFAEIRYLDLEKGGKGFAITEGFKDALSRKNDLIGFVDADMATSPTEFYSLIKNIGDYEGIITSRAIRGAKANFTLIRKITHRGFNFLVRSILLLPYQDTQCGAKLFKREVIKNIVNEVRITEWAFDINLLYLCKKKRFKIKEIPTVWEDKRGSKLRVIKTTIQMFLAVVRLRLIYSIFEPILKPIKFILIWANKIIYQK